MNIQVTFLCGHGVSVDEHEADSPVCLTCGERRIQRVSARPPRFRGACQGPNAIEDTEAARPRAVSLASKPLKLKDFSHGESAGYVVRARG